MKQFAFFLLFFSTIVYSQQNKNLTKFVNPFIGTGGHGHTFPNACKPFGNVQMGPVTDMKGWDRVSGYHYSDSTIMGFSHTRLSGTGCADLSDILFMPRIGKFTTQQGTNNQPFPSWRSRFSHKDESATPGYYSVLLKDYGIKAEFTASNHCAIHRYTFPANDSSSIIISPSVGFDATPWNNLKVENDSTISGVRFSFGWVPFQKVFFVARFSKPFFTYQMTSNYRPNWKQREREDKWIIGSVYFKTKANEQITVKVGISAVSLSGANNNLDKEIGNNCFETTRAEAESAWNDELNKIQIEADSKTKEIFYTGMYHAFIQPNNIADIDGRYRGADYEIATSKTGKYYSTLSLWDTYRALHPLYSIIQPRVNAEIIQSMIEHQQVKGFLPIWTLWGAENYCMIANHAIPVIADAILKGNKGFDYDQAYAAIKSSSTLSHQGSDWELYNKYGYYPNDFIASESVSKTLEVSFDDWCVAQVAKKLGKDVDYNFFINRSKAYQKLYDTESRFFRAKDSKGKWMTPFNPINILHSHGYTEGNAWQYYWSVQQDIPALVGLSGGKGKFDEKLDSLFTMSPKVEGDLSDVSGLIGQYAHGNEPSHHVAYLYNYADQPRKTQKMLTRIMAEMYRNEPDGLSGNEDCGQMSAWYIFTALGFYPVNPASGVFDIGRPFVQEAKLNLENGKTFLISVKNTSDKNIYVKKILLNNVPIANYKLNYTDIMNGGTMVIEMGK